MGYLYNYFVYLGKETNISQGEQVIIKELGKVEQLCGNWCQSYMVKGITFTWTTGIPVKGFLLI